MFEKISQQKSQIDAAIEAHKDTAEWNRGESRRSMAALSENDDAIKDFTIKNQQEAFYSVYDRGDESAMRAYNEMLTTKASLHSDAVNERISSAKYTAGYINPFKAFSEYLDRGKPGKAATALLFSPILSPLAAGVSLAQGIGALKEKIQLSKTKTALGLTTQHLKSLNT